METTLNRYGPWALVLGGSEGLGAAWAEALAKSGMNLVLVARRLDLLEQTATRFQATYGVEVRTIGADLADTGAASLIQSETTDLDVGLVVYNAGLAPIGSFLDMPLDVVERAVTINTDVPSIIAHEFGNRLRQRGGGGLVFVSSIASFQGSPGLATYAGTKAFLRVFAESLWAEFQPYGIDVLVTCPGAIRTPSYAASASHKTPGEMDAAEVVRQSLRALGKKPLAVPGAVNALSATLMTRLLSHKTAIRIMQKASKQTGLSGDKQA